MNILTTIMVAAGLFLLIWSVKRINPGTILLSAVLGIAALFAADLIFGFTHVGFSINYFTVLCAALAGIPGVILVIMLNTMMIP